MVHRDDGGRRAVRKALEDYTAEDKSRALAGILAVFAKEDIDMTIARGHHPSSGGHRISLAEEIVDEAQTLCSEFETMADCRRRQGDHDTAESFAEQASAIQLFVDMVGKAKPAWEQESVRRVESGFRPVVT